MILTSHSFNLHIFNEPKLSTQNISQKPSHINFLLYFTILHIVQRQRCNILTSSQVSIKSIKVLTHCQPALLKWEWEKYNQMRHKNISTIKIYNGDDKVGDLWEIALVVSFNGLLTTWKLLSDTN